MPYKETKVYYDGSHFIAIPKTTRPPRKKDRPKPAEEVITIFKEINADIKAKKTTEIVCQDDSVDAQISPIIEGNTEEILPLHHKKLVKTTKKELFEKLYAEHRGLTKPKLKNAIIIAMKEYFKTHDEAVSYVNLHLDRKHRNLIARRIRCVRKANLQDFNYFVTLTYDDKLHDEESFVKRLKGCLKHFSNRKEWRYIGVLERSPKNKRLHFHGIFCIPDGTMPELLFEKNDYNVNTRKRQITVQNTYFNVNFGRSDFSEIAGKNDLGEALGYILKYLEKTGERIVYSKGLSQFFISDIEDRDVVCRVGVEDKKLLLFDDFSCFDEGIVLGKVSTEIIKKLRKSN